MAGQILTWALTPACLALPCSAADGPQGLPLADLKTTVGKSAKIEAGKDGFLIES